jgi:hypothetical protein
MNNFSLFQYENNKKQTSQKNSFLRSFMYDTNFEYAILYNNKTELRTLSEQEIEEYVQSCISVIQATGIQYLTGKLQPVTSIDYGAVKIDVSTINEQKIVLEFISRKTITEIGYFDVRFTDNCSVGDYAYRLSKTSLYPDLSVDKIPWVFGVSTDIITGVARHVYDELSAGWFQYKYQTVPHIKAQDSFDNLKSILKAHKKANKDEQ